VIVAGIDLSLVSTGVIVAEVNPDVNADTFRVIAEERIRTTPKKFPHPVERLWHIASRVLRVLREYGVEDVAIEGYAFSRANAHAHALGELGGTVRLLLWRAGIPFWNAGPTTLKKLVTGKGNAPKDVMLREVFRRWGYDTDCNDLADAYGLCRAVAGHHVGHARKSDAEAWSKAERVEARGEAT